MVPWKKMWNIIFVILERPLIARLTDDPHSILYDAYSLNLPVEERHIRRLDFLAEVVSLLKTSYNQYGANRWFVRKRDFIAGRAIIEVLKGDWDPNSPDARKVLTKARNLLN